MMSPIRLCYNNCVLESLWKNSDEILTQSLVLYLFRVRAVMTRITHKDEYMCIKTYTCSASLSLFSVINSLISIYKVTKTHSHLE